MAKVIGPLFSLRVSGAFGELVFDKRGFVRPKGVYRDRKTTNQGNFRQALTVAQRCVKVCGPLTRQQVKNVTPAQARWNCHLMKELLGPQRASYSQSIENFTDPAVDQAAWEGAAVSLGLRAVTFNYADEAGISPGAQLFILASTLFHLGIYTALGQPAANAEMWGERIGV
jgi:hypothetical protein